jgi:V8-like Glu-specific endopeptidase
VKKKQAAKSSPKPAKSKATPASKVAKKKPLAPGSAVASQRKSAGTAKTAATKAVKKSVKAATKPAATKAASTKPAATKAAVKKTATPKRTNKSLGLQPGGFLPGFPHKSRQLGVVSGSSDDRRNVLDSEMRKFPFNVICRVRTNFPRGSTIGTAWYVSSDVLVTAGHVVRNHDAKYGGEAKSIDLWSPERQRWERALRWVCTADWERYGSDRPARDFAAIKSSVASNTRLTIVVAEDAGLAQCGLTIAGYPGDKQKGFTTPVMLYATSYGCRPTQDQLHYTVDTMPGESGAAVFTQLPDRKVVCLGIHNYGDPNAIERNGVLWGRSNTATRITSEVYDEIHNWIRTL